LVCLCPFYVVDIHSIWYGILPPLGEREGASSLPSAHTDNEIANATPSNFDIYDTKPIKTNSVLFHNLADRSAFPWTNETCIARLVQIVVEEVLYGMGKLSHFRVIPELGIFGNRPDLWIITHLGKNILLLSEL
jgi:hypothetical protein